MINSVNIEKMDEPIITQQRESCKLTKTTKGYTWEIKLLMEEVMDDSKVSKEFILLERLEAFNKELIRRYGTNE